MRYVFFGGQESRFAQLVLEDLKKAGMTPAAEVRDAKAPLDLEYLKSLKADVFVVAAFGKILKKDLLEIPPKGTLGVHPSLLPKYRGASPIQSAILAGEHETGVAIFQIDEGVDHGPVLASAAAPIADTDTYETMIDRLAHLGSGLLVAALPKWLDGTLHAETQDETQATFTKKFVTEDAKVDLKADDPKVISRKIRALNPEPGAFTILSLKNGKQIRMKLLSAELKEGTLTLLKVQPEGKKPMAYKDFLNGYKDLL